MRKSIIAATLMAGVLIPSTAFAAQTCSQQRTNRVVGTVAGGAVGAVLGNVIAGRGDKTLGTVLGGVGGAVAGNQIAKPSYDCKNAYGYYDEQGRWHATAVSRNDARGYYDRDGNWVNGAPNGSYDDNGRWVRSSSNGTYSNDGHWIPAGSSGYYDRDERWIATSSDVRDSRRADAYGYYDTKGSWHATMSDRGRATGYYDRDNRWVEGTPNGYYDDRGRWIASRGSTSNNGYYDDRGRWVPGSVRGYYDRDGQWIATTSGGYRDRGNSPDYATSDTREREAWLEQNIRSRMASGELRRGEANNALRELASIRRADNDLRNGRGRLSARNEANIQLRLDRLSSRVRITGREYGSNR